jgi:hypothetical protein
MGIGSPPFKNASSPLSSTAGVSFEQPALLFPLEAASALQLPFDHCAEHRPQRHPLTPTFAD